MILLIEDDDAVRESLARVLVSEGWTVATAVCGDDALPRLAEFSPKLVITDLCMAGINGWDILLECRIEYSALPIFVISALEPESSRGAIQVATRFFQKPLDLTELLKAAHRYLGTSNPTRPHPSARSRP